MSSSKRFCLPGNEFLKRFGDRGSFCPLAADFQPALDKVGIDGQIGCHVWASTHQHTQWEGVRHVGSVSGKSAAARPCECYRVCSIAAPSPSVVLRRLEKDSSSAALGVGSALFPHGRSIWSPFQPQTEALPQSTRTRYASDAISHAHRNCSTFAALPPSHLAVVRRALERAVGDLELPLDAIPSALASFCALCSQRQT